MPGTERGDWRDYLALPDEALLAQCDLDRFRASGPGGQKRNKTESAVRLRHRPTGLQGEAVEERSQHLNRARALRRLRREIALTLRVPVELESFAPEGALAEALRRSGRIEMGRRDARYLEVIARLFDVLEASGWQVARAAAAVGVTTSQLMRFIDADPAVLRAANERRRAFSLDPLRASR